MITANLHDAAKVTAESSGGVAWLEVKAADGSSIGIFMPLPAAEAMAAAFNAAMPPKAKVAA